MKTVQVSGKTTFTCRQNQTVISLPAALNCSVYFDQKQQVGSYGAAIKYYLWKNCGNIG